MDLEVVWSIETDGGMEGSPALCDLDDDGKLELIYPVTDEIIPLSEILAIDPVSGVILWTNSDDLRAYAYPYCIDVDDDGIRDVLVAGRNGDVVALSGIDGMEIWKLSGLNPESFPDVTENMHSIAGTSENAGILFVSFRGDRDIPAPGGVIAFDSDSGTIRAVWEEPDGREIYSSPAVYVDSPTRTLIAIGSGGESLPGELFVLTFNSTTDTFWVNGSVPAYCDDGGIVSSPVFGDLDGDGEPEAVATDFCGRIFVADKNGEEIWTVTTGMPIAYANPLLVDLDRDGLLDAVGVFSRAASSSTETQVVAVNGSNGSVLWLNTMPAVVVSSLISYDINSDGTEDIVIAEAGMYSPDSSASRNGITILDGTDGRLIARSPMGSQMGTPVIGDVDGDGAADIFMFESGVSFSDEEASTPSRILGVKSPSAPVTEGNFWSGFRGQFVHDGSR